MWIPLDGNIELGLQSWDTIKGTRYNNKSGIPGDTIHLLGPHGWNTIKGIRYDINLITQVIAAINFGIYTPSYGKGNRHKYVIV